MQMSMSAIQSSILDSAVFVECFDMAILLSCMLFGWFTWSLLFSFMKQRRWQQHLRTKVACADAFMTDVCTGTLATGPDSVEQFPAPEVDDAQKVRCLLESYGAFGASPGTWSDATGLELDSDSESSVEADAEDGEDAESDVDWEAAQDLGSAFQSVAGTENNLGMLFEHYSLFQSEPGTWYPALGQDFDETSEDSGAGCDDLLLALSMSIPSESDALVDAKPCSADDADTMTDVPMDPPHDNVAMTLFEQYSLFGAQPGTWSKDSDCSTNYSSESDSAEATDGVTSDANSDAEVDNADLEDLVEQ